MLCEIRELGFTRTELSHGIRMTLVPGILKAVEEELIEISSIHNFCPLPSSVQHAAPNLFQPSAKKKLEREQWLRYSRQSLEFAERIGAEKIVMHSGSGNFRFRSPVKILENSDSSEDERKRALVKLEKRGGSNSRNFDRTIARYQELIPFAQKAKVELCAENREGILELPLDQDFPTFLDLVNEGNEEAAPVSYWHDTGHAQIKHLLGLIDHEAHLERLSDRLTGFHLHDVSPEGRDHQTIGTGTIDFSMISRFVQPEHTLVLELSPSLSKSQVLKSREFILDSL